MKSGVSLTLTVDYNCGQTGSKKSQIIFRIPPGFVVNIEPGMFETHNQGETDGVYIPEVDASETSESTGSKSTGSKPWTYTRIPAPVDKITACLAASSQPAWATMAQIVQRWLLDTISDDNTDDWQWGVNLFWVLYTANHPKFPAAAIEDDPANPWDRRIPIICKFLHDRMAHLCRGEKFEEESDATRLDKVNSLIQARIEQRHG